MGPASALSLPQDPGPGDSVRPPPRRRRRGRLPCQQPSPRDPPPMSPRLLPALAAALLAAPAARAAAPPAPRPNVVVLLCDDLGYGDLGCFGHKVIKTPHLDRLAAGGLKLTHCYAAAPVCSPSRCGLLTGRTPNGAGIYDWVPPNKGIYLKKGEVTAAALLREAGYATAHVGKWHLNSKMDGSQPTPGDHG